jgi:hypothetical protein
MAKCHKLISNLVLGIFLVGCLATNVLASEPKRSWQGISVKMFMGIKGQQFSYVAGFMDSAVFAYHELNVNTFRWLMKCMVDHPEATNPVEITKAVIGKFNTVIKDHPGLLDKPVGLFILAELENRCGQIK